MKRVEVNHLVALLATALLAQGCASGPAWKDSEELAARAEADQGEFVLDDEPHESWGSPLSAGTIVVLNQPIPFEDTVNPYADDDRRSVIISRGEVYGSERDFFARVINRSYPNHCYVHLVREVDHDQKAVLPEGRVLFFSPTKDSYGTDLNYFKTENPVNVFNVSCKRGTEYSVLSKALLHDVFRGMISFLRFERSADALPKQQPRKNDGDKYLVL